MEWLTISLTAIIAAAGGALPLWLKIKAARFEFKEKETKLALEIAQAQQALADLIEKSKQEQAKTNKIDTEAEWKRLLEYREKEIEALRNRDDSQDKQIRDLYTMHVACERDKARMESKLEAVEKHQNEKISTLQAELQELKALLKEKTNVPSRTSDVGN